MKELLRVTGVSPRVYPGRPEKTVTDSMAQLMDYNDSDIIVLPAMWLTPPSLGSFLDNKGLLNEARNALATLASFTEHIESTIITSLRMALGGKSREQLVVLSRGNIVTVRDVSEGGTIYRCGKHMVGVVCGDTRELSNFLTENAVDVVINIRYQAVVAGMTELDSTICRSLSAMHSCGVMVVNGGYGDTSSPLFYRSYCGAYCLGETMDFISCMEEDDFITVDFDADITGALSEEWEDELPHIEKETTINDIRRRPYLPADEYETMNYLVEVFDMQVSSLVTRARNISSKSLVIGVSGGLDSTLALLVAVKAADVLGMPRNKVIGITMPGFGTSGRTYNNAITLIKSLGADFREISIVPSVKQHLDDISHSIELHNVTYENAQARERTQILLDIANDEGGLVVGTGDLSEEALGWCTFGGDHLANYNVNVCVTKTMIREMVEILADSFGEEAAVCLRDILDTPVSPELLPTDEMGDITQKTEEILGPYELHDFFLYYLVKYGFAPKKILAYAVSAFGDELSEDYIADKLAIFLKRFAAGQFKRACAPDSAVITDISLSGAVFSIPSDLDISELIDTITE